MASVQPTRPFWYTYYCFTLNSRSTYWMIWVD